MCKTPNDSMYPKAFNSTDPVNIYLNGEFITWRLSGNAAFGYIARAQGQSVDYACRHGGWSVEIAK